MLEKLEMMLKGYEWQEIKDDLINQDDNLIEGIIGLHERKIEIAINGLNQRGFKDIEIRNHDQGKILKVVIFYKVLTLKKNGNRRNSKRIK